MEKKYVNDKIIKKIFLNKKLNELLNDYKI